MYKQDLVHVLDFIRVSGESSDEPDQMTDFSEIDTTQNSASLDVCSCN